MYGKSSLPVTEYLSENILAIPVHHGLDESSINTVIVAFKESLVD
jgi:dTDP-4-amino-4,6-dideoxygalactose transaminase